jgi:hypothetical protein
MANTKPVLTNGLQAVVNLEGFNFHTPQEETIVRLLTDGLLATTNASNIEPILATVSAIPSYSVVTIYTEEGIADITNQIFGPSKLLPDTFNLLTYLTGRYLISIADQEFSQPEHVASHLATAFAPRGSGTNIGAINVIPTEYSQRFLSTVAFEATLNTNRYLMGIMLILAYVSPENMAVLVGKITKALNS